LLHLGAESKAAIGARATLSSARAQVCEPSRRIRNPQSENIMELKIFLTVFGTIFLAELGDKTQLATVLFASEATVSRWLVFFAASLALVVSSGIGVLAGSYISEFVEPKYLAYTAGVGFIIIGVWTVWTAGG
jgi:putative Ca2+/H+ antiporter (TMEM165/GDT1 family)